MLKGKTGVSFHDKENNTVRMDKWLQPTLLNLGENSVTCLGVSIPTDQSFVLGPPGVIIEQELKLKFIGNGTSKAVVIYTMITKDCTNN